jgi:hypothetical protein
MGSSSSIDVEHAAERHENRSHAGAWERGMWVEMTFGTDRELAAERLDKRNALER